MYKYRVIEFPCNMREVIHPDIFESERDAKVFVCATVSSSHNMCTIERLKDGKWERGDRVFMWFFERVCSY